MESLEIHNSTENLKLEKINIISKREIERKHNLQKKKDDINLKLPENEKLEVFETLISDKQLYIMDLIENSKNLSKKELPDHFNIISKEIAALQKYVAASNIFLRNYDLEKCKSIIEELATKSKVLEGELLPKKKFTFKNKSKKEQQKYVNGKNELDEVDFSSKQNLDINVCGFFNKRNENLLMTNEDVFKKDVTLNQLENCQLYLKGTPSALHLNNLKNCRVLSGPVSTSIFAENCENCTFVIACQQLRLHASKNINIYLHVTSRAIMEDCTAISVAPYNWEYDGIQTDFQTAMLDIKVNNWKCIDDFNWLNVKHSPNWKEIDEDDRIKDWIVMR